MVAAQQLRRLMAPGQQLASKHCQSISVLVQETLEIFVEANGSSPDSASTPDKADNKVKQLFKNMKPSAIKQKIRGEADSDVPDSVADDDSQAGGSNEMLEGHLFSVGVAFAQVGSTPQMCRYARNSTADIGCEHTKVCAADVPL